MLETRFRDFWRRSRAEGDPSAAWSDLECRWSEPHRAYHSLAHLAHCLDELDGGRDLAGDAIAVELALWCHDAVYDTHASDNEHRSAALAGEFARSMGLPDTTRERAARLVLATRHDVTPSPGDEALVVDIDLAILGQPPERFDEYERGIRAEYAWVPRPLFDLKRRAILRAFLERPSIYATERFRARYEASARANLRRSLGSGVSTLP